MQIGIDINTASFAKDCPDQTVKYITDNFDFVGFTDWTNSPLGVPQIAEYSSRFKKIHGKFRLNGSEYITGQTSGIFNYQIGEPDKFIKYVNEIWSELYNAGYNNISFEWANEPDSSNEPDKGYLHCNPNYPQIPKHEQFYIMVQHLRKLFRSRPKMLFEGGYTSRGMMAENWKEIWNKLNNKSFSYYTNSVTGYNHPYRADKNVYLSQIEGALISAYNYSTNHNVILKLQQDYPNTWIEIMTQDFKLTLEFARRHNIKGICLFAVAYYFDMETGEPNQLCEEMLNTWMDFKNQ